MKSLEYEPDVLGSYLRSSSLRHIVCSQSVESVRATGRSIKQAKDVEQRRFTGPRGTKNRNKLAWHNGQRNITQCFSWHGTGVSPANVLKFDERRHHRVFHDFPPTTTVVPARIELPSVPAISIRPFAFKPVVTGIRRSLSPFLRTITVAVPSGALLTADSGTVSTFPFEARRIIVASAVVLEGIASIPLSHETVTMVLVPDAVRASLMFDTEQFCISYGRSCRSA